MTWKGGYTGESFNRSEFRDWLKKQEKPKWAKFMVAHNTDAPYTVPPVPGTQRIKNLGNYYRNQLEWSSGPHLFVLGGDRVYLGTPISVTGTGSPSWNGTGIHVEAEGKFTKASGQKLSPSWDTMAWIFAEVLSWLGLLATSSTVRLHREDTATTHRSCPGDLVEKDWLVDRVKAAMGEKPAVPIAEIMQYMYVDLPDPSDWLNFRQSPAGPVKGRLLQGMRVRIIRRQDGWAFVESPGAYQGWISAKYLSATEPVKEEAPKPPEPVPAPPPNGAMPIRDLHASQFCQDWFKRFEGKGKPGHPFEAYDDRGTWAIGYGHNASSNRPPIPYAGMKITEAEADKILKNDLEAIKGEVAKVLGPDVKLEQGQFDAMLLDCFQRGQTQFTKTSATKRIKEGDMKAAYEAMVSAAKTTKDAGLQRRRLVEAEIFNGEKPTKW